MPSISAPNEGRAQAVLAGNILILLLPFPFIALRIWARQLKRTPLCFNDYMIFLALIFTSGFNADVISDSFLGGYGQHEDTLSHSEQVSSLKVSLASTFLWPTANTCIKISVLHFYKAIFPTRKTVFAVYALGTLVICYWITTVVIAATICTPFNYNWDQTIKGHCGNIVQYYLSTAILNLLIDVMIVALPLPLLWGLQMQTSRKVSLTLIFSLGASICVFSVVRCNLLVKLNFADETYDIVADNICTALEPTLGCINACLPLLQPVATKISGSKAIIWVRSLTSGGTSQKRFSGGQLNDYPGSENRFQRLPPDLYPLSAATQLTTISVADGSQRSINLKDSKECTSGREEHSVREQV